MSLFLNNHPLVLYIIGAALLVALLICAFMMPSILRYRKSKPKGVERVPATLVKIIYETGGYCSQVYFQVDGEKHRRSFESRRGFVTRMPEIGTKGMLTCKGHVLYSFEWADQKVVQDDPAYGKTGYADMI